jgi:mannose-6-phosphate isomerase-like protein (cupin superfamily)
LDKRRPHQAGINLRTFLSLLFLFVPSGLPAQGRKVDPTWLHRYVPSLREAKVSLASDSCHYKAIFGDGDSEAGILRSVSRCGEITLGSHGACRSTLYDGEEELYLLLAGTVTLHDGDQPYPLRANDFTYIAPRIRHSIENNRDEPAQVLVMGFRIPAKVSISHRSPHPKIVNMDDVKEETVEGHPTSVLYKLLAGPRTGKRDAIDEAYVVASLFWMDFAPGGTNFPHHHETAEEIYLVIDGEGDMVAGGGMDGIEGRHPAKAGDAYYFRSNCTVGFYNQDKPGARAHILAARSRIPWPEDED